MTRWLRWHDDYADERSPLSRRLRIVRGHITTWLDERPDEQLRVVSVCAGQGHDLLGVLADRPDRSRVRARLIEYDAANVALARQAAAGLGGVEVLCADAGDPASYAGAVPADLVLLVGVLGNIGDADVERTIAALPQLCAAGATVIWSRSRRPPDLVPTVRRWFEEAGFNEVAVHAPDDVLFTVGVHRFAGIPQPLTEELHDLAPLLHVGISQLGTLPVRAAGVVPVDDVLEQLVPTVDGTHDGSRDPEHLLEHGRVDMPEQPGSLVDQEHLAARRSSSQRVDGLRRHHESCDVGQ